MANCLKFFIIFLLTCTLGVATHAQNNTLQNGSIIITLITKDTIWIGADSRTSSLTDKGYTTNELGMCKIHYTNNVVYAMSGHVRYTDNSFNFLEIMDGCVRSENNFDAAINLFKQKATSKIESILKKFSTKSIKQLIKQNNGAFLSVVALTFVNNEKQIHEMRFSIEATGRNKWKVNYREKTDNDEGSLRFMGHATQASLYVKENPLFFGNGMDIPGKIIELIKIESAKGSTTVGMPADVISVYNNGFKRTICSGLCP